MYSLFKLILIFFVTFKLLRLLDRNLVCIKIMSLQRQETATKTASYLCTLQRLLAGSEAFERALCPVHDPTTGSLTFPDTEAYGEFLDSESW